MGRRRVRAYVGLGANVGDASGTVARAVVALADLPGVTLRGVSSLYVTAPVGVIDQPDFHNAVVALDVATRSTAADGAIDLLTHLKALERSFGRRVRGRWGPRELDLDLLIFGRSRLAIDRPAGVRSAEAATDPDKATKLLVVPHPDASQRLFVLAPLADLAPSLVPPGWGETVETARQRRSLAESEGAVQPVGTWDPVVHAWRRDADVQIPRPT